MKRIFIAAAVLLTAASVPAADGKAAKAPAEITPELADYFRNETAQISTRCLTDIRTLEDWTSRHEEYRRQLAEMLGLWPMPARTDLRPVITGKLDQEDFEVENLEFQASPHLHVTANLYLPKKLQKPAPAILYVCGHSRAITNGVSLGNKTGYQHHGAWFARNGYVCLTIDTLQFGEILGVHRGTYSEKMWWWNSRGYTPAGVETWLGIRALDYLCARPEVDKERIGMTGRSGGGAYTWMVAALDDRVKVACPVAGITDLQNHIVDGCIEGHCDCMFFLNTYRWDYPQLAALIAPRPLLIGNSDKDRIFPLDGVLRLHEKVRQVYSRYGANTNLGLLITEGPHEDTQDLQVPVVRWFNRFLKGDDQLIEMAAKKFFDPQKLRVFKDLPEDERNTEIHTSFVPAAKPLPAGEVDSQRASLLTNLLNKTFSGWPAEPPPLDPTAAFSVARDGLKLSAWDFTSQQEVRLRLYVLENAASKPGATVALNVLDAAGWRQWLGAVRGSFEAELKDELRRAANSSPLDPERLEKLKAELVSRPVVLAFVAPRGVGRTAWPGTEKQQAQIRRRFMLLGQTLDGMRVWDIRRAVQMIHFVRDGDAARVELRATDAMSSQAQLAALFEPSVRKLEVGPWREPEAGGGDYLNFDRYCNTRTVAELLKLEGKLP